MRWNLTRGARHYAEADAIFVSIPKSGRTWLMAFLRAYFCGLENRPFTMNSCVFGEGIPKVKFTHDLWVVVTARRLVKDWLRGRSLIPYRERTCKPILLLARDPRDVIVSLFFHLTKRYHLREGRKDMVLDGVSELVRHNKFGMATIIDIMNIWIREWGHRPNFKLIRYEDLRRDPKEGFSDILRFLGLHGIDQSIFSRSLELSSFENLKAMEASGVVQGKKLRPVDVADPESFKVRRGKVGGYKDYFGPEDINYVNEMLSRLDKRYGYAAGD